MPALLIATSRLAPRVDRGRDGGADVVVAGHVGADVRGLAARRLAVGDRGRTAVVVDVGHHDLGPSACEEPGRRAAQPRSPARDQGDLAREVLRLCRHGGILALQGPRRCADTRTVAKTVDRRPEAGSSPQDVGRQLRHVRRKQGLSRSEVARSAGLTRRELAAYERGRVDIPESDLWCLAGSCGVDVGELLPHRDKLRVDSDLSSLAIGDTIRHLRSPGEPDGLLTEYLSMIYELRNLPPGTRVPLRDEDLHTLADALGGSPDLIESRLGELIGANREEAARLRAMILPPLSLPAPGASDVGPGDFFATPRAEDPFAPPPPLETGLESAPTSMDPMATMDPAAGLPPMEPMDAPLPGPVMPIEPMPPAMPLAADLLAPPTGPAMPMEPVTPDPTDPLATLPVDPFSLPEEPDPLAVLRADPFAPPGGAPPTGPRDVDPDAAHDGIVVDFGEPVTGYGSEQDSTEPMVAPHTVLDLPAAPLSEAPIDVARIDVAGIDAPAEDVLPELGAPVADAFADAFDAAPPDAAPFESVPFDRIPFGIETDIAEPALGSAPISDDIAPPNDEPPTIDAFLNTPIETGPFETGPAEPETVELHAIEPERDRARADRARGNRARGHRARGLRAGGHRARDRRARGQRARRGGRAGGDRVARARGRARDRRRPADRGPWRHARQRRRALHQGRPRLAGRWDDARDGDGR